MNYTLKNPNKLSYDRYSKIMTNCIVLCTLLFPQIFTSKNIYLYILGDNQFDSVLLMEINLHNFVLI